MKLFNRRDTQIEPESPDARSQMKNLVKNDLLGADEWKRSKFGYLTGLSAAQKAAGSVANSIALTGNRLRQLYDSSTEKTRDVEGLLEPHAYTDGRQRFLEAQRLQYVSDRKLETIVRNTYRSFWLYGLICAGYAVAFLATLVTWPPSSIFEIIGRLGPFPLIAALALKSSYTNWVVRRRSADTLSDYIKSKSWLPHKE